MPRIGQHEAARRDLVEHFVHIPEEASLEVAERFLANAQASFELLATQPQMGAPLHLRNRDLAGLRKWRVDGFDNFLIFYVPRRDGISVVRILHGSRDRWGLFGPAG